MILLVLYIESLDLYCSIREQEKRGEAEGGGLICKEEIYNKVKESKSVVNESHCSVIDVKTAWRTTDKPDITKRSE